MDLNRTRIRPVAVLIWSQYRVPSLLNCDHSIPNVDGDDTCDDLALPHDDGNRDVMHDAGTRDGILRIRRNASVSDVCARSVLVTVAGPP